MLNFWTISMVTQNNFKFDGCWGWFNLISSPTLLKHGERRVKEGGLLVGDRVVLVGLE